MARSFRRKGFRDARRYVSRLDPMERALVVGLLEQVHDLVSSAASGVSSAADGAGAQAGGDVAPVQDEFDRIVAGMGAIGLGVSLAAEDQEPASSDPQLPRDPALERLLPVGNRQDPEAAAEFRALTEQSLVRRKLANLEAAMAALAATPTERSSRHDHDKVSLTEPEALALMVSLTDVRLVLADRLGLATEADTDELQEALVDGDPDDPRLPAAAAYDFLSWLQESLALAMLP